MGILDLIIDKYMTPERVGRLGEKYTARKLGWMNLFGYNGTVMRNVYIPLENGETTEIDLLYITKKGIFVIESKNYSGYVFGDAYKPYWTITLYGGKDALGKSKVEKHKLYNPIWQNHNHIKFLCQYLKAELPMFSLIVFSERCELKSVTGTAENTVVCKRNDLPHEIKTIWNSVPDRLTEAQVEGIYDKLLPLTNQDEAIKQKHVEDIKEKLEDPICPRCGAKLVIRTAHSGANAGKQFYGCSNFPKCRFTTDLPSGKG